MSFGVIVVLVVGLALLLAMVLWNDWHPARRREIDLYEDLDEPEVVIDRRSRVVHEDPVYEDPVYEKPAVYRNPVMRRRVTSRRSATYDG